MQVATLLELRKLGDRALPIGRIKVGESRPHRRRDLHLADGDAQLVVAPHGPGLVVEHPRKFDPKDGLAGLEAWGGQLRLRKRRRIWLWLLLLPLFLLLRTCDSKESFFGFEIDTHSLIVIVDKSGSMEQIFPAVRQEAKKTLGAMKAGWFGTRYANVITYDGQAQSALGRLSELDDDTEVESDDDVLEFEAPSFTLTAICTDASGNEGSATATPAFPSDDDNDDEDSDSDD